MTDNMNVYVVKIARYLEGICFNVFMYNVQPGLDYIYSTGESKYTGRFIDIAVKTQDVSDDYDYILNNRTMLIHKPGCENALRIGARNKIYSYADKSELIQVGYRWAECCKQ